MTGLEEIVLPDGTVRRLGNIDPPAGLTKAWPVFGTVPQAPIIPRDQWPSLIAAFTEGPDHPHRPPVHDQDGVGQCNADASTTILEHCRSVAGLPYIQLSAADLYEQINGGVDRGSLLEDAIASVMTRGVATAATCGTIWRRGMTRPPATEPPRFKLIEAFLCETFDHVMSSVLSGFADDSGVVWYNNYFPANDGWLPAGHGGGGGHAIYGFKPAMKKIATNQAGVWKYRYGIWHQQSWGGTWSPETQNCFVLPEEAYGKSIGGWWAARAVTDEGGVVPTPPSP